MKSVIIEKVVFGGLGLARVEGQVIFVPFTIPGEEVLIEITSQHKNFARGRLVEVLKPSPQRVKPPCPYFGRCGGCQLQHMSYEEQLRVKEASVKEFFPTSLPLIPAPETFYYRKKIAPRKQGTEWGFTGVDNKTFIPIERCLLFSDKPLKEIPHYKEEGPFCLADLTITLSPEAFCQNFPAQSRNLYLYIQQLVAQLSPHEITDLYCGVGITSLLAARTATRTYGYELNQKAINLALLNAHNNRIHNVHFKAQKAENAPLKGALILLNPPRTGVATCLLQRISSSQAQNVIYTSCNPATLQRDISKLEGFTLKSCQPFDMFPQTSHVELVALLQRTSSTS